MKKVFSVPDMSCQHCVGRIKKALDAAGIAGYDVDLASKEVRVETDAPEKIAAVLDDAGYPATVK